MYDHLLFVSENTLMLITYCYISLDLINVRSSTVCFRKYSYVDHVLLHNTLSTYDWSSVYNDASYDAAVDTRCCCNTNTRNNCPYCVACSKKGKFLCGFSETLKYCINTTDHFYGRLKKCISSVSLCALYIVCNAPA